MIHVGFHGAHVTVQPWRGENGETGRALIITDGGMVVTLPLNDEACREVAGELLGGLVIPKLEVPADVNGSKGKVAAS